jgi:hypothetical protein
MAFVVNEMKNNDLLTKLHKYVRDPSIKTPEYVEISIPKPIWDELLEKDPSLAKLLIKS